MSEVRANFEGADLLQLEAEAARLGVPKAEAIRRLVQEAFTLRQIVGVFSVLSTYIPPSTPPYPQPEIAPPSRTPAHVSTGGRSPKETEEETPIRNVVQTPESIRTGREGESEGERTQDQVLPEHGLRGDEPIPEERLRDAFPDYPLPEPLLFPGAEPLPKKRKKRGTWTADNLAESRSIVEEIAAAARAKRTKPVPAAKLSLSEALAQVPEFAEFWTAYPKRQGGVDAFKAWQQTASSRPPLPSLLSALQRQVAGLWAGSEARFVPLAGTWLRGERWNDEVGGGAVVPMPAAARASPGVDLPALKRAVQAEVGGALGGRMSREALAVLLDEMETINDEPSLRRWADEAVRR